MPSALKHADPLLWRRSRYRQSHVRPCRPPSGQPPYWHEDGERQFSGAENHYRCNVAADRGVAYAWPYSGSNFLAVWMVLRNFMNRLANNARVLSTRVDHARFLLANGRPRNYDNGLFGRPLADDTGLISAIIQDGSAKVIGHWTREECDACIESLKSMARDNPKYPDGRFSARVFSAEALTPSLERFHSDAHVMEVAKRYCPRAFRGPSTFANRVDASKDRENPHEGWHRATNFRQFMACLYLNDVDEFNGPLQFISRSHSLTDYLADIETAGLGFRQLQINETQIERIIAREPQRLKTITGGAGTLILADTASIHRQRRPAHGESFMLTNYYVDPSQISYLLMVSP